MVAWKDCFRLWCADKRGLKFGRDAATLGFAVVKPICRARCAQSLRKACMLQYMIELDGRTYSCRSCAELISKVMFPPLHVTLNPSSLQIELHVKGLLWRLSLWHSCTYSFSDFTLACLFAFPSLNSWFIKSLERPPDISVLLRL